jgi:hypothetical protein
MKQKLDLLSTFKIPVSIVFLIIAYALLVFSKQSFAAEIIGIIATLLGSYRLFEETIKSIKNNML